MQQQTREDHLWKLRHGLLWCIRLSALYHRSRERFIAGWDRAFKFVAVVGGSAAAARLGGDVALLWIGIAITTGSAISLVFGLAESARRHGDLASQHKRLEAEIVRAGECVPDEKELHSWRGKYAEIESAEPAALYALTQICERQLNISTGHPEAGPHVGAWRAIWAQYWSLAPTQPMPAHQGHRAR